MAAFLLAHISDPHLAPLPQPRLRDLIGKRIIGYVNWRRNRHLVHKRDVVDALVADLKRQHPDHIAVTGDLVNIALPEEILRAGDWLRSVGDPDGVTLVPGNHDAYVPGTVPELKQAWGDYMRGDDAPRNQEIDFPFVRRRGPLTLIGVSSAVPTAPFMATGTVGGVQLRALENILQELRNEKTFRVLMIHHPLLSSRKRRHARLTDSEPLLALLRRYGVDLVLHGHDHRRAVIHVEGPTAQIPVVGVPSASIAAGGRYDAAAYHLFAIEAKDKGWHVAMTTRGFANARDIEGLQTEVLS